MCSELDKKDRNFVWGSSRESRKVHLINWNEVCQSKDAGGLGLRHSSINNMACMMKIGWKIINNRDDLWVRIVRSKYGYGDDLLPVVERKRGASNLWKGVCNRWNNVDKNISWCLGNGNLIRF